LALASGKDFCFYKPEFEEKLQAARCKLQAVKERFSF
jgi:hypothetical protein